MQTFLGIVNENSRNYETVFWCCILRKSLFRDNERMKINFLGIGAQKCASTWIYRILSDHPEVAVYDGKEIDFFSAYYDRGYQWYEGLFNNINNLEKAVAIGEISPSYFVDSDTPKRAFLYNPNMRIILSLRDPIERAYSNHLHQIKIGYFAGDDLDFDKGMTSNPMYIEQSRYAMHLARWLAVFPSNQIFVLFQEEIRNDPLKQSKELYRFLGLSEDHHSRFLEEKVNESYGIKNVYFDRFLKTLGRLGRAAGAHDIVESIKRNNVVNYFRCQNQINLRQKIPPINSKTKDYIQNILAEDMSELAQQLDRKDLPWPSWRAVQKK